MKKIIFILTFFAFAKICSAQTAAAFEQAGDAAYLQKDFNSALQYYIEASELAKNKEDLAWKMAETARQYNSYSFAEKNYQKVIAEKALKKYPAAKYYLALMKKYQGKYDEAKTAFDEAIKDPKTSYDFVAQSQKEIKSCDWALGVIKTPKDITIDHLGKNINTPYSEFAASEKEGTLYFSSLRFENKDDRNNPPRLLTKVLSNEDTSAASKPIKKFNAENKHTAYTAFSPTSNRVYYTNCVYGNKGDEIVCTIFYREKNDDSFSKEVELPDFINFKGYSNSMPHLAIENGQEILYFVSNRPDGKGKNDIWYSIVLPSGGFSYPVNCASINTREDEMSPYYHVPNKTLYFSSNGYESLGGLDVFASEKNKNIFATPKNMGVPLNSSYNDLYFNLSEGGTEGYLASNRLGSLFLDKKNETCCYDVYKVELGKKVLETPKKETTKPPVTNVSNPPKTTNVPPTTNTNVPKDKPKEYNPPTTNNLPPAQNTTKPPPDNYKPNPSGTKFDIPTNIPKEYGSTPNYTSLEEFLPLPLYFDNDEPDRNTKAISTSKTYEDAFNFYYKRKYEYIEKNLKGSDRATSIKNMDELFEKNIRSNFILLQKFTPILMARLYKGESIEIIIKGFASPLAKNDYNNNLGKRRVASLVNFWKKYEGGLLKKYFDNGQLKVSQVSFGEDTAAQNVSDDQYNEAASIYSVGASKERRIEIIEIKKK